MWRLAVILSLMGLLAAAAPAAPAVSVQRLTMRAPRHVATGRTFWVAARGHSADGARIVARRATGGCPAPIPQRPIGRSPTGVSPFTLRERFRAGRRPGRAWFCGSVRENGRVVARARILVVWP